MSKPTSETWQRLNWSKEIDPKVLYLLSYSQPIELSYPYITVLLHKGKVLYEGKYYVKFLEALKALSRVHLLFNPERSTDYFHAYKKHGVIHLQAGSNFCIHTWYLVPDFTELEKTMDEFIKAYPGFALFIGE